MPRLALLAAVLLLVSGTPAHADGKHFLWKISKGSQSLYLTGSVHMLKESDYPLPDVMENSFRGSVALVEELDLSKFDPEGMMISMYQIGSYPDGQSLKGNIPPELYAKLSATASAEGLDMQVLDRLKPWLISITLEQSQLMNTGYSAEAGVDMHFTNEAKAQHKLILGLEKPSFQFGIMAGLPEKAQESMLEGSLVSHEANDLQMNSMVDAWKTGDQEMLTKIEKMSLGQDPDVYQAIIAKRNANWMPELESMMATGQTCFVVVGALHLVGPDGLLAHFKKDGYTVEQL